MHKKNFVLATLTAVAIVAVLFASTTALADPVLTTTNPDDYFTTLIENYASIGQGYAIFEFKNPLAYPINITPDMFYAEVDILDGKPATLSFSIAKVTERNYRQENCVDNITGTSANGSQIIEHTCGSQTIAYNSTEFVPFTGSLSVSPGEKIKVRVEGKWEAGYNSRKEWYPAVNLSGTKIKQNKWALWSFDLGYCTNVTATLSAFNYTDDQNVMAAFINFSSGGTNPLPYNESIRIANKPCGEGGTELSSALIPFVQNSSGNVAYGLLAIKQNGTVGSSLKFGLYYNTTATTKAVYGTDLEVINSTNSTVRNSYFDERFTDGALSFITPIGDGNDWDAGYNGVDGLIINGSNQLLKNLGTCSVLYNFSIAGMINCSRAEYSVYHIYFAKSYFKYMYILDQNNQTNLFNEMSTTNTGTGYGGDNTTYSNPTSSVEVNLPRGVTGVIASNSFGKFWLWRAIYNNSIRYAGPGAIRAQPGSYDNHADGDNLGRQLITSVFVTGADNITKIHNATRYWEGFINTPLQFTSGASMVQPTILPPNLTSPANGYILGVLPEFNWTLTNADNYTIKISTNSSFGWLNYTRNVTTNRDQNVSLPTGQINTYFWRVTAFDDSLNATSSIFNFTYSQWNITFNITSGIDGSSLNNVNISSCTYSNFNQNGYVNNTYGPYAFPNGTWTCTLRLSNYFDKMQTFNADSDKIVNVTMNFGLTTLIAPSDLIALGILPEFNWTNVTAAVNYMLQISKNSGFFPLNYTNNVSIAKDTNVALQSNQINTYFWRVIATDGTSNVTSSTRSFNYSQWSINFNITGSQQDQPTLNSVIITSCTYSSFNQSGDTTNTYGPYQFPNGTWNCTFTKSGYYDYSKIFNADSDKTVNVVMPETGGATYEEHTWLEAIYNCVILKECDLYNLLLEINQTAGYTWQHFKPTDGYVVRNETFVSTNLSSTSNLTINYSVYVPIKAGYILGTYLPIRIGFWFLNETNGTCLSQGALPDGVTVADPYCNPVMVQTLGPMGNTVNFTVNLRPNLTQGVYVIKRLVEIDPDNVWVSYGQEDIGLVNVNEPNTNYDFSVHSSDSNVVAAEGVNGLTGNAIASPLLSLPSELALLVASVSVVISASAFLLFRKKHIS